MGVCTMSMQFQCDKCKKELNKEEDEYYVVWYCPKGSWKIHKGTHPKHLCMGCAKKIGIKND